MHSISHTARLFCILNFMYIIKLCILNIPTDLFNKVKTTQKMDEKQNGSYPVVSPEYLHQWWVFSSPQCGHVGVWSYQQTSEWQSVMKMKWKHVCPPCPFIGFCFNIVFIIWHLFFAQQMIIFIDNLFHCGLIQKEQSEHIGEMSLMFSFNMMWCFITVFVIY